MCTLDLVISVDTLAAHLAGALGLPVWTLLPAECDWRWMRDRDDSPWYPTMRLFRQTRAGRWADAVERVAREMETEFARSGSGEVAARKQPPTLASIPSPVQRLQGEGASMRGRA
jgi:hypothetical protein